MVETTVIKPRAMRATDAAKYIGVAANTLKDWRYRGVGPSYRLIQLSFNSRPTVLYLVKDLDAFIDATEVVETAGGGQR